MAKKKSPITELKFPIGGLVRRAGFDSESVLTTGDCLNVRPFDVLGTRERGGSRPGLVKFSSTSYGSTFQGVFPLSVVDASGNTTDRLVVIANGNFIDTAIPTTYTGLFDSTSRIYNAVQIGTKLYVANVRGVNITGTGTLTDGVLTDPSRNFSTLGITPVKDLICVLAITDDSGNIQSGSITDAQADIYGIQSVTSSTVVLTPPAAGISGTCNYQINRQPFMYDPTVPSLGPIGESYGIRPLGCPLICAYRTRLVFAGPNEIWYMSRMGDPTDWDYGAIPTDPARAVAGDAETSGGVSEPIVALMPHSDDYIIFGCRDSLWVLRGDAASGGQIDNLSRTIGVISANAWCNLPDSSIVFLSRDGLYLLAPGAGSYPQSVSRENLPAELLDLDPVANTISMAYDTHFRGIHIFITPSTGSGTHWWIDWIRKTFWPVSVPATMQPNVVLSYSLNSSTMNTVLLACADGYLRNFSASASTDDGTAISSYVTYGPMRLGGPGFAGMLLKMAADVDTSSGSVTWNVYTGTTDQVAASKSTLAGTGTWVAGMNYDCYPHARGNAHLLSVSSSGSWAMEAVRIVGKQAGRAR